MEIYLVSFFAVPRKKCPDFNAPEHGKKPPPRLDRKNIVAFDFYGRSVRNEDLEREADKTSLYWRVGDANVFLPCVWVNPDTGKLQYANRTSFGDVGTDSYRQTPRHPGFKIPQERWMCNRNLGVVGYANWTWFESHSILTHTAFITASIIDVGTGTCVHVVNKYTFEDQVFDYGPFTEASAIGNDGTVFVCHNNGTHALGFLLSAKTGLLLQEHVVIPLHVYAVFAAPVSGYIFAGTRSGTDLEPDFVYWNPRIDPRAERPTPVPVGVATDVRTAPKTALELLCVGDAVVNSVSGNGFYVTDGGWSPLKCAVFRIVTAERVEWIKAVVGIARRSVAVSVSVSV